MIEKNIHSGLGFSFFLFVFDVVFCRYHLSKTLLLRHLGSLLPY